MTRILEAEDQSMCGIAHEEVEIYGALPISNFLVIEATLEVSTWVQEFEEAISCVTSKDSNCSLGLLCLVAASRTVAFLDH